MALTLRRARTELRLNTTCTEAFSVAGATLRLRSAGVRSGRSLHWQAFICSLRAVQIGSAGIIVAVTAGDSRDMPSRVSNIMHLAFRTSDTDVRWLLSGIIWIFYRPFPMGL